MAMAAAGRLEGKEEVVAQLRRDPTARSRVVGSGGDKGEEEGMVDG